MTACMLVSPAVSAMDVPLVGPVYGVDAILGLGNSSLTVSR